MMLFIAIQITSSVHIVSLNFTLEGKTPSLRKILQLPKML